jgi:DNA-binding NarL/FixJ family response regulator
MTIRVLICDDQDLVRDGLRTILSTAAGIEVVGEAADGAEAVTMVESLSPDVVLMDLKMPGVGGITATRQITDRHEGVRVLVLTTYDAPEWVDDAIRAGASGYLMKDTTRTRLIEAVKGTAAGQTHVDPDVAGQLFDRVSTSPRPTVDTTITDGLTDREIDVFRALGHGLTNGEISARLFLSEGTVRNYVSSLISKLGVVDRTQAAVLAVRHGLIGDER